ncbi:MAG: ABC transporter substrate-binding protein, partial [Tannerellaceae bacterium]|nr:ABC transporter substrate-binding protein [Tannerellaceae bacterium]
VLRGPTAIAFAGWFEQSPQLDGKNIELSIIDSPGHIQALLLRNQTDMAVLPMINTANLYNKGIEYRLAGCPIWGNLYLIERENTPAEDKKLYIFGAGATPDILTRYYCELNDLPYSYNYTFQTAGEIVQAIYARKVNRSVMAEPYLSMILQKDSTFHIIADLNKPNQHTNFVQTAVIYHKELEELRPQIDSLLALSCNFANLEPEKAIGELEKQGVFPPGSLTSESIERCNIRYVPLKDAKEEIQSFLELIFRYEPRAIGEQLPGKAFYK